MSYAQFTALMEAIASVRNDLTERLDRIDARLREVEVSQAQTEAVSEAGQTREMSLRWRLGIAVSAAGVLVSLALQLLKLGGK